MGFVSLAVGQDEAGSQLLDAALDLYQQVGDKVGQANIYSRRAMMLLQANNPEAAEPFLGKAVNIGNQIDANHPTIRGWSDALLQLRAELAGGA